MDPVELLGGILRGRSSRGGFGQKILQGILGGAMGGGGRQPMQSRGGGPLGGLIQGAMRKYLGGRGAAQGQQVPAPIPNAPPCPTPSNDQATILIRAMINAAKSDGQFDQSEHDAIIGQLGKVTQQEEQFLRQELSQQTDVREFARSVPKGLEDEVYAISVTAIDLDTRQEAQYLHDLAQALNLSPEQCNQIHEHFGAPQIFR